MAGLIKREDIDAVRERADLREVVEQYVTLKGAGIGSWKGLCPFHDERSPSFHIRPQVGTFHCFGCGESGDVIAFLMGMEHTSFQETVEKLAGRMGIELRYEDGGKGPDKAEIGRRQRLLDAHKIADEFFQQALQSPEAQIAREMLTGRGFTREHAAQFSVGYAPKGWDNLLKHLRSRGFSDEELTETGMFSSGGRGIYDRFRGRLMWPIRDMTGNTVGFGGRHLYEEDKGPKYLNSPETSIYKKSQVLYGIDHAKRHVAKERQLVVVEGYTDVMACHVAGVQTAVATCGTAFGEGHIRIARRLISDEGGAGEVIFTFDGDAAGQQAALKAFKEDHMFLAKTFIAVGPEGMDPCDIRQQRGDDAVKDLISSKTPLFEFAIRAKLREFDLDTIEGRVGALRATAPIVGGIKDPALRPAYTRELAGWLGAEMDDVARAVTYAQKHQPSPAQAAEKASTSNQASANGSANTANQTRRAEHGYPRPDTRDPAVLMERQALEVILQHPTHLTAEQWEEIFTVRFSAPAHQAIHDGVRIAAASASDPRNWVQAVRDEVPEPIKSFVSELAVTALPTNSDEHLEKYCQSILNRLVELKITHQKANLLGRLQRMDPAQKPEEHQAINRELMELESRRRALREAEWA